MLKRVGLVGLFVVAACGSAIGNQAQTLALAYKSGDTYSYHYHAVLNYTIGISTISMPVTADVSANEKMTVKSVDSSGTADLSVALSDLSVKTSANGVDNTTTTNTPTSIEMKVASDGHVVSVNGKAIQGSMGLPGIPGSQGGLISAVLPDKPVKPGDTWTKNFDDTTPVGSGTVQVSSDNKYTKDEKVGSVNTAVVQSNIHTTINLTIDTAAMAQGGGSSLFPTTGGSASEMPQSLGLSGTDASIVTSWVDAGAKRIVKTHQTDNIDLTLTITMPAGATANPMLSGPITVKGSQTLDMTPA